MPVHREELTSVRIDKWLWAARFFKTRRLAAEAVGGGKVELNGARPKPAKEVKVGDEVRVRTGPYLHVVYVRALSERRGPAADAANLYEETTDSRANRALLSEMHRLAPAISHKEQERPTKKDRRDLSSFHDRHRHPK